MPGRPDEGWIVIPNWDKFQHYGKRNPVWIKVYTELNSRDDWGVLSWAYRGLMVTIWIEYARSKGQLSVSSLRRASTVRFRYSSLVSLSDAGFIQLVASKPLALRYQAASKTLAQSKRREDKEPLTPQEVGDKTDQHEAKANPRAEGTNPRAVAKNDKEQAHLELVREATRIAQNWNGKDSLAFDEELDQLQADYRAQLTFVERDDLWDKAFKR